MKIIFVGCSTVSGVGFDPENPTSDCKNSPDLWVNLCHKNIPQFQMLDLLNLGKSGVSNTEIFTESVSAIGENSQLVDDEKIQFMIISWTSYPRYYAHTGFELYNTGVDFKVGGGRDINLNNFTWPKSQLEDLIVKFRLAHHPHYGIIEVLKYCWILENLAKSQNIKIFFVNNFLPWDQDYFVKLEGAHILPVDYTTFTKTAILNIDNRCDQEIYQLYNKLHDEYTKLGGVNLDAWINLYQPLQGEKIDVGYDNRHAGADSNKRFFQIIKEFFVDQGNKN